MIDTLPSNKSLQPMPVGAVVFSSRLSSGMVFKRLIRALQRTNKCTEHEATNLACSRLPYVVNHGLTEAEALYGQFELICCDSISAFIRSQVLSGQNDKSYLETLLQQILASPEFRPTQIEIYDVPETEAGQKFLDQFRGLTIPSVKKHAVVVPFKKAGIMHHWAARIGARIVCNVSLEKTNDESTL